MSRFLNATFNDMRSGRETWRVFVALVHAVVRADVRAALQHIA